MVRLSSHPLKRKVLVVITDQLIISLLRAKTHKDAETTLKALLSEPERIMIAKRLAIALLLEKKCSFSVIKRTLKVSQSTIARIQNDGKQGRLSSAIRRFRESGHESNQGFLDALETLLRAGMPPIVGPGRWRYLDELAGAPPWKRRR
ncbi:MAG: hypothetical protein A3D67_02410 [Candidatus Lloydbacteria bacterium RIFCSPHIGHO2_02_FULL_51_22]|uniref:Uncharacterized protein n=3 Tax=Candidatus Lloydiibacteriota TaxID=1817910 RepID=A0A1G2DAQ5_9BACT|nr:MAG: hypothetical protein A3D67_02410 [Candidatus Lloydbacteria bacterium RIFCSPHIGHO2_02_FULL_51_22]OGZ13898.1 MAG: hypothetical protein A3J08_03625 [Candidatus Lloydbacteria bacterium RIFCSPLOWO2_02_FULL_51_11]OGZ16143.1 MAG: hypothetical protein A3G11_00500 [Candidatus Lloydbacteria bacterium RIFCSPLOWO2_12_FULL_51_9]